MSEIITSIDVGTTKICTFIAEVSDEGTISLLGAGCVRSEGLRKGVIVNVSAATQAITESIEMAEHEAGVTVRSAYVGIVGAHISSHNSTGAVAIPRGRSITRHDIDRALDAARAIPVPSDRDIIHTIARSFKVDQQEGVQEPIGMHAYRLEVDAHIITGATTAINNLVKCVRSNGVAIEELVLEPLASGEAVLTPDERDLGVVVVDMGGGTTDLAIYLEGSVWHTVVLDVGGDTLTRDLAMGLRTPFKTAEQVKIRYGHAQPEWIPEDDVVSAAAFGEVHSQNVSRRFIAEILEARSEEILHMILREIRRSGYDGLLPAGVVLTGGSAQLQGLKELGRDVFRLPVRTGIPNSIQNVPRQYQAPAFACGLGLLLWGQRNDPYETSMPTTPTGLRLRQWLRSLLPG
ncbi:MAG: cell division protein FtsA [Caldilineae bacterium]|nr:MAG: cell division protein FtsA [Caldilineae bacterium]